MQSLNRLRLRKSEEFVRFVGIQDTPSPTLMVRITTFLLEARSHCAGLLQYCDFPLNEPYAMSAGTVGNPISKSAPPSG